MVKRDQTVDILRGIGVVLMIIGHIFETQWTRYIYSFHMPLFFFLSGYCSAMKETLEPPGKYFLKKCRTLLIPYVVFFFMFLAIYNLRYSPESGLYLKNAMTLKGIIKALVFSGGYLNDIPLNNAPLWFLPHLFIADTIFYGFRKLWSRLPSLMYQKLAAALLALALMAVTVPLQSRFPFRQVLVFNAFPTTLSFMLLGWLFKSAAESKAWRCVSRWLCPLLILAGYFAQMANVYDGVPQVYNIRSVLFFVAAMCSILGWFSMASRLDSPILSYIGRNSLIFLGMHLYVFYNFTAVPRPDTLTSDVVYNAIRLVVGVAILSLISWAYNFIRKKCKKSTCNIPKYSV